MRRGILLTALVVAACCVPAGAQDERQVQTIDTGGARALGMGNAFTALADDIEAILWNPAGLARLESRQAGFVEAVGSDAKKMRFVGYAQPDKEAPGGALSYLRVSDDTYALSETSLSYTFAQNWSDRLSVGANVRYSRLKRREQAHEIFNTDVGLLCDLTPTATLGVAVLNVLSPRLMEADRVSATQELPRLKAPRLVNAGITFRFQPYVEGGRLGVAPRRYRTTVGLELFDATDQWRRELRFGVEQRVGSRLVARAGLLSSAPTVGLTARVQGFDVSAGTVFARSGGHTGETMLRVSTEY
ncbi:MAG: UPF0164 family protein [Armatimonadetes bacterium]|nr:UPF0164 family protein [Armatimonadota bacterium]